MWGNRLGCRENNYWHAERLPYNNWSDTGWTFPSIDDHRFSDKVCDAPIEKPFLAEVRSVVVAIRLRARALRATNTGGRIKSKRIAFADSVCVFATDTVGAEKITEGSSGK